MGRDRKWNKLITGKMLMQIQSLFIPGKENAALNLIVLCTKRYIQPDVINILIFSNVKHLIYKYFALEKYLCVLDMDYSKFLFEAN